MDQLPVRLLRVELSLPLSILNQRLIFFILSFLLLLLLFRVSKDQSTAIKGKYFIEENNTYDNDSKPE